MNDPLNDQLTPHLQRAQRLVAARLADARAHAHRGDVVTATRRLADLHHALIGPDGSGAIGDAKAAFYRHAHADFDPELHDPARRLPTPEGAAVARTAPILGRDAYHDAASRFAQARMRLVVAAVAGADTGARSAAIETWHAQQTTALAGWARGTLSDAQMAIHQAVADLRLRPEWRLSSTPRG